MGQAEGLNGCGARAIKGSPLPHPNKFPSLKILATLKTVGCLSFRGSDFGGKFTSFNPISYTQFLRTPNYFIGAKDL